MIISYSDAILDSCSYRGSICSKRVEEKRIQVIGSGYMDLACNPSADLLPPKPAAPLAAATHCGPRAPTISRSQLVVLPFLRSLSTPAADQNSSDERVTIRTVEDLREKIQQRSTQSSAATEKMKTQREEEERVKLAMLMPRVCDEIRFLSQRGCRSTMILSECVEGVVKKLNDSIINSTHVELLIQRIAEIVPEYIVATASGVINGVVVPATIRVDNRIAYNQTKIKLQQATSNNHV